MPSQGNSYTFEDLSGVSSKSDDPNPYNALINACQNDPAQIQLRYNTHRTNRERQQRDKLLSPEFPGVTIDNILRDILDEQARPPQKKTGFQDPRHCLVFWARPPHRVRELVTRIQMKLKETAPNLWFMPDQSLHMTALEVTHSLTAPEIASLVSELRSKIMPAVVDWTYDSAHRARLVKPVVTYDAAAFALSFLPAAGEPTIHGNRANGDEYSYHHLRRDLWEITSKDSKLNSAGVDGSAPGVHVASRYVVPSAHLTIGRFVSQEDVSRDGSADGEVDHGRVKRIVKTVEEINAWLQSEFWLSEGESKEHPRPEGEWLVGEEKGLDFRAGQLWYGSGGETISLGRGF